MCRAHRNAERNALSSTSKKGSTQNERPLSLPSSMDLIDLSQPLASTKPIAESDCDATQLLIVKGAPFGDNGQKAVNESVVDATQLLSATGNKGRCHESEELPDRMAISDAETQYNAAWVSVRPSQLQTQIYPTVPLSSVMVRATQPLTLELEEDEEDSDDD